MMSAEPTKAQRSWQQLGYGMFIHFGVNTFARSGWGDGRFPAAKFCPQQLDCSQWTAVMAEAGMRYAVLTAKHHDGFCLWPSKHTAYSVAGSPSRRDVVGEFVQSCRSAGIRPGLYYSLWDRNCPFYDDDAAYAKYMLDQLSELLRDYGPLAEIWFDGGWDKDFPSRSWDYDPEMDGPISPAAQGGKRWRWRELYEHIHALQADCLVLHNSSSHQPGGVKYHPVDARTSEHFDFIHREQLCRVPQSNIVLDDSGNELFLPIEFCATLSPDWFWTGKSYAHHGARAIASWYKHAQLYEGNLLLNVGPDPRGLIPEYHREILRSAKQLMGKA